MQDFKKAMKQEYFLEFQIDQGLKVSASLGKFNL